MTHVYPISLRGANYAFILLILFLPVFAHADNAGNYGGDSNCCDSFDYWIKFPKDAEANCVYPDVDDIEVHEGYCDLLAVSKTDKIFNVPGSSNCYKIFRTYGVVNWCEYVDGSDPVVVGRDEDCDGKPGDEDIYVLVQTMYGNDPCEYDHYGYHSYSHEYQHVWYDRDTDPYNNNPAPKTKGYHCDYESNPKGSWKEITDNTDDYAYLRDHCEMASVGYWQYTQVIKVTDYDKPEISFEVPEPFCSYSSDIDNGCPGQVELAFSVQEDCSPEDISVKAFFDQYADGDADWEVTEQISGSYPDYSISGSFPLGIHDLVVKADDGCGNVGVVRIPFEVNDCKGPSPICINGLTVKLMPVIPAADADGDGDDDEGAMELWASDFVTSQIYDCTGPISYSVNLVGDEADIDQTNIILTCDNETVTLVEVHAWDGNGNNDFCVTYVQVQSEDGLCPVDIPSIADPEEGEEETESVAGTGLIAGRIATEYAMPVEGVMIQRTSAETDHQLSNILGEYLFANAPMHEAYLIEPHANGSWVEGISISDLHLLKKYLMGLAELDSPYKMLAADLDGSGSITEEDLDLLWKVFLFQGGGMDDLPSWRFVPSNYLFPDAANPWMEEVPNNYLIPDLEASMTDLSFVAVKLGDLDESIRPASQARSARGEFAFQLADATLQAGQTKRIDFRAEDLEHLAAYQMSLAFDPAQLEVVDVIQRKDGTQRIALKDLTDGLIHTAWHRSPDSKTLSGEAVFSLVLKAKTEVTLSESLRITRRGLPAEAVGTGSEQYDLELEFKKPLATTPAFAVEQNQPNPFRTQTQIRYFLPEAAEVNLRITDVTGKLLREIRTDGFAGENVLNLSRDHLSAGVLFYTLTAGEHVATKKMLLVK